MPGDLAKARQAKRAARVRITLRAATTAGPYHKCGHGRGKVSLSEATDIRVRTPACQFWKDGE